MHVGTILLTWLIIAIIIVAGLIASGILSIHIEIDDNDKPHDDEDGDQK